MSENNVYEASDGGLPPRTGFRSSMAALLPENPTQFDYLHAIRAVASRAGLKEIFDLADAGMFVAERPVEFADDFAERVLKMDAAELRSRVLCQRDYLKRFYTCLDGLPIPAIGGDGIDGCRDHHTIRRIVTGLLPENAELRDRPEAPR